MPKNSLLRLDPSVAGLSSAIAWLRDHDVPAKSIAAMLGISEGHARQLAFRGQWRAQSDSSPAAEPFSPIPDAVRLKLGIRPHDDTITVKLRPLDRKHLDDLEAKVDALAASFWSGVRYGAGIERLRSMLIQVGHPAHFRRIRLLARIRQLLAETYLHAGHSLSAVRQGRSALMLFKIAFDESGDRHDLTEFAKSALIVSQGHLLRVDPLGSRRCLELYQRAHGRISEPLGAEYHRQLGVVALQTSGDTDSLAIASFSRATITMAETVENGRPKQRHEVLIMGARQRNLLVADWDSAMDLVDYFRRTVALGDIQIPMTVNWAAATGLTVDSPSVNQAAIDLLEQFRTASVGFGHQATISWLLRLTVSLPKQLRPSWVRRALYENTFKDY